MSYFKFQNVGIRVLSATVPKNIVKTRELKEFPQDAIEKFIETTGVEYRRFAGEDTCTSDLCYTSACENQHINILTINVCLIKNLAS